MTNIKKNEKQPINTTNLLFTIGYAVITIVVVFFTLWFCAEPFVISNYEEMKQLNYDNYLEAKPDEYYIIIYSDEYHASSMYEDIIVEYANYARTHSDATPIYAYNYDTKGNNKIKSALTTSTDSDIIRLIKVVTSNGSHSLESKTGLKTWKDIHNTLTAAMNPTE